jgi:hypothetical protein
MNQEGLKTAAVVIAAVAKELAQKARDCMPNLREGEVIRREWYENGIYYRETSHVTHKYDFKLKECELVKGAKSA